MVIQTGILLMKISRNQSDNMYAKSARRNFFQNSLQKIPQLPMKNLFRKTTRNFLLSHPQKAKPNKDSHHPKQPKHKYFFDTILSMETTEVETDSKIHFHQPPLSKRMGERFPRIRSFVGQVTPSDIVNRTQLLALQEKHPDLFGDTSAIGFGDDGKCQSWQDCPGWWKEFVDQSQD